MTNTLPPFYGSVAASGGTGPVSLGAALPGHVDLKRAVEYGGGPAMDRTIDYLIRYGNAREWGTGIVQTTGLMARTNVAGTIVEGVEDTAGPAPLDIAAGALITWQQVGPDRTVGRLTAERDVVINGASGTAKLTALRTNNVTRWQYGAASNPETGANAGSNFELYRYSDAGAFLGSAMSVSRASGGATFAGVVTGRSANTTALRAQSTTGNLVNLAFQSNTGDQVRLEAVIDGPDQGSLIPKGAEASVNLGTTSNPWNAAHFAGNVTIRNTAPTFSLTETDGQEFAVVANASNLFINSVNTGGACIFQNGGVERARIDFATGDVTAAGATFGGAATNITFDALTGRIDQQSGGFSYGVDVGTLTGINPNYHMKSASGRTGMLWELDNDFLASDGSEAAFWAFAPFDTLSAAQRAGHYAFRATIGAAASTDVFTVDWNGTVTARQNRIAIADPVTPANRSAHLITFDGAANAAEIGVRGSGAGGVLDARITFDGRATWPHVFAADGSVQHTGTVTAGGSLTVIDDDTAGVALSVQDNNFRREPNAFTQDYFFDNRAVGGDWWFRTSNAAVNDTIPLVLEANGTVVIGGNIEPRTDNTFSFGTASRRATVVYAATGTIQTSDARTKQDRALISDSLLDAVDGTELVTYRLRDAVAEKGDGARLHTGAVAQEFEAALTANGIDGDTIAALCHDTWTDADSGGQQDRYGLRYDQFNILLHAAVRRRLAALEDRLARLERG
ncbi:tail fiber domain-containing protein [Eilatimonas milleporae]|uniref:Endosialidase-like protein n=1 Tax=Eilatimonas milleporae TaxID=911205 RepID=A0A3M0CR04_9PROT|nr:tail fiber domain-containing protein [Eilatimonas milleporae]RMB11908.1 endosialidase-like protein [Eilatimonas milleporae]